MEYGHSHAEVVSAEESARRCILVGDIGIRAYNIKRRLDEQNDLPFARQFTAFDLYVTTEKKESISLDIPGQQILPIEFSE